MNSQYSQDQSQEKESKPQEDRYKKPFIIATSLCVIMALSVLLSASGFSFASAEQKIEQAKKKEYGLFHFVFYRRSAGENIG